MTVKKSSDRDMDGEALVLETMAQGHSLECAWKAVYPSPSEMMDPPTCIDGGGLAWVTLQGRFSTHEVVTAAPGPATARAA